MSETTPNPTAGEVLAAVERERAAWDDLLAEVGEDRMLEPGPMGGWTFKDLAAHLTVWEARYLARFEAAANGQEDPAPPWPADLREDDEINAWIREQHADRLLGEVLEDSRTGYARLAEIVQRLPEEDLADPARFPWMDGEALGPAIVSGSYFDHVHRTHEPEVRAWLAIPPTPKEPSNVEL